MSRTINCNQCGEEIEFSDNHVTRTGKKIPLDRGTFDPHDCPEKEPYVMECRECGLDITFSDNHVSKSGKKIPIDPDTGQSHQCAAWFEKRSQMPKKYVPCRRCK